MIDKGMLYRQNFRGGGADMGAGASGMGSGNSAPGPGDTGGEGGYGPQDNSTSQFGGGGEQFDAPGTLSDIREKQDYFGPTAAFGPARKYTGSFLDNIFGRGYRTVTPSGDFQSRLSQAGGFGKSIFGGILGLLNPLLGVAYKVGSSIPSMRNYDTLADYARGEFGLFQRPGVSVDQGRGSGLRPTGIMQNLQVNDIPPGMDLNDYEGYRDREYIESAPVNKGILDIIDYTDPYQGGTYG
jgi:hypothetical protein